MVHAEAHTIRAVKNDRLFVYGGKNKIGDKIMNVQITTDSTCDLNELITQRNIGVMPLSVILGVDTYRDGVNITPQDIFAYVEKTGELPKTAAPSITDFEEFFEKYVSEGKKVVHYNISSKASASHQYAQEAAKKFPGQVFVIDSRALSGGQGLLVLKACDLAESGKSAEEIAAVTTELAYKVQTSFVPDRLDYLYKGGRCSRMAMYGANLLKIHPLIEMIDGQLVAEKKLRGSMERCIAAYLKDLAVLYPNYDKTRCLITHSCADESVIQTAKQITQELFAFDEIIETVAGSVITGHCGRNTLGLLFIKE